MTAPTALVTDRLDALHALGHDVSDADSTHEALSAHNLTGWNVRTVETYLADGTPVRGGRASVATIPGQGRVVFGQVGKSYRPVQTEDFAGLLDTLGRESGAALDVVATTNRNSRVLIGLNMPEPLRIGDDLLNVNMVAMINHLTGANRLSLVPFRLFCANQQPQIITEGDDLFVLRHTVNAASRMDDAGRMLTTAAQRLGDFELTAKAMLATPLSDGEFMSRVDKLFPKGGTSKAGETRFDNRRLMMKRIFTADETNANIRHTAWGGYQSVLEYLDHYQGTRQAGGDGAELPTTPAQRRALRALTGGTTQIKLAALNAFSPASLN